MLLTQVGEWQTWVDKRRRPTDSRILSWAGRCLPVTGRRIDQIKTLYYSATHSRGFDVPERQLNLEILFKQNKTWIKSWRKRMADGPRLSPKCQMFFNRFVNRVNKQSPKPADWEYFYDFMSVCSDQKSEVTGVELYHLLIDAGFPQGSAQPLSMFYKQGWSLLNRPEGFDQIPTN